jgi:hypothetical protein
MLMCGGQNVFDPDPGHRHALRKIGFFAGGELARPRVRMELGAVRETAAVPEHLETLWAAASARKWVEIVYASPKRPEPSNRKVDPFGLVLRRGVWSLVGYCHLRQGLRTFHVHRIRSLKMNPSKPRTHDFEVPADFLIDAHVPHTPWQWGIEPPVEVRLPPHRAAIRIDSTVTGAEVVVAGRPAGRTPLPAPVFVEPGRVRVTIRGRALTTTHEIEVRPGEVARVPFAPPSRLSISRAVLLGVGGALAITGAGLAVAAWRAESDLESAARTRDPDSQLPAIEYSSVRGFATAGSGEAIAAVVTLAVGGAALLAGTVLALVPEGRERPSPRVGPAPGGLGVAF